MPRVSFAPWQFIAIMQPYEHFAFWGGVATGKTYTGSHFCIKMIREYPHLTGFIGSNTYDQLTQATLRELFQWLDFYGYDYVIDRQPPLDWKSSKRFKKHTNILTVRDPRTGNCTTIFTRILAKANPIRGIQFSWYWLDETRDTPENTHDVVISRMRENKEVRKGLITSTTNGEDWSFKRFGPKNIRTGQRLYGSMHVPTIESVRCGIISQAYYDTMLSSYSPVMADQELNALHVNPAGGRAYYAAGNHNRLIAAPWGDLHPNPSRNLLVGCDFNFSPAPCVWVVGQVGPAMPNPKDPNGPWFDEQIHWFKELSETEISTPVMANRLIDQYPGFFFEVYGDASGNVGTTSNAGETDFNQMAHAFQDAGVGYTIDVDQRNPLVRDRVENMNALFLNGLGQVRQTFSQSGCPLMDEDVRNVGWKPPAAGQKGRGKLDDRGVKTRTHSTDAAGYVTFKKFPPARRASIIETLPSSVRSEHGLIGTPR
jgi:hypothetical protein